MERTLVLIKPDGVKRGLVGEIISRYERKDIKIAYCKLIKASYEKLKLHYAEHKEKSFYKNLIDYMSKGYIIVMVLEGENVVEQVRKINGNVDPIEAEIGSIRGDFATMPEENLVHGSDSTEAANREIEIWI